MGLREGAGASDWGLLAGPGLAAWERGARGDVRPASLLQQAEGLLVFISSQAVAG